MISCPVRRCHQTSGSVTPRAPIANRPSARMTKKTRRVSRKACMLTTNHTVAGHDLESAGLEGGNKYLGARRRDSANEEASARAIPGGHAVATSPAGLAIQRSRAQGISRLHYFLLRGKNRSSGA